MRFLRSRDSQWRLRSAAGHRTSALATLLTAAAIVIGGHSPAPEAVFSRQVRFGVCQREVEKLLGDKPVRVAGNIRPPKKLHNVAPNYPKLPPGTSGRGMWAGEALIDTKGYVARVWSVREVEMAPPFPAFNKAIVDAIRQWRFEPVRVNEKAMPVCMTVTVNINWR